MQGGQKLRSEAHGLGRRSNEITAQRRKWIFCEAIKIVAEIWILTKKKNVRVRGREKG
jgi:hypothetical protein